MFWSICAPKGGIGTSVCAAALALELSGSARPSEPVLLVDFGGDQGDILGVDCDDRAGVVDWLESGRAVDTNALDHLVLDVAPGLQLLPRGRLLLQQRSGFVDPDRCVALVAALQSRWGAVIADVGVIDQDPASPRSLLVAAGDRATCVVRACYLNLRRVPQLPIVFDDAIELVEPARALITVDVEAVLGQPIAARMRVDPAVARAVDAGLLVARRPRPLRRAMADLIAGADVHRTIGAA